MRKMMTLVLATLLVAVSASAALAQIDVEMAFDPAEVHAGDTVTFFIGIANLGDADVVADLEMTLVINDMEFGPFPGHLPLAAGEELSHEFSFMVIPLPFDFTMSITVTATAGDFTDTATATLTVYGEEGSEGNPEGFAELGQNIMNSLTNTTSENEVKSLGGLKNMYR